MIRLVPLRLSYFVSKHGPVIAAVLLVLGTAGLGTAGWIYTHPPTTEVTDHRDRISVESSLSTHAVTTGESSLYPAGTLVENQPVYLVETTPNLTLTLRTRLPPGADGRVEQHVTVVYTATRDGEMFWKRTERIDGETTRERRSVVTRATVSMATVLEQVETYRNELGDAATVSVNVRTTVEYGVGEYEGEFDETTPVSAGSGWYAITPEPMSRTHSTPTTRTVELGVRDDPTFFVPGGLGASFVVAGVVVAGVHYRGRRRSLTTLERDVHHERYADWISRGRLPRTDAPTTVRIDSLEGLVDVGIDTGERVIYDPVDGHYAVLRDRVEYIYDPESHDGWSFGGTPRSPHSPDDETRR